MSHEVTTTEDACYDVIISEDTVKNTCVQTYKYLKQLMDMVRLDFREMANAEWHEDEDCLWSNATDQEAEEVIEFQKKLDDVFVQMGKLLIDFNKKTDVVLHLRYIHGSDEIPGVAVENGYYWAANPDISDKLKAVGGKLVAWTINE